MLVNTPSSTGTASAVSVWSSMAQVLNALVVVMLFTSAASKLFDIFHGAAYLNLTDSALPSLHTGELAVIAIVAELAICVVLFMPRMHLGKSFACIWLATCFAAYHAITFYNGTLNCPCFGFFLQNLGATPAISNGVAYSVIVVLLFVGVLHFWINLSSGLSMPRPTRKWMVLGATSALSVVLVHQMLCSTESESIALPFIHRFHDIKLRIAPGAINQLRTGPRTHVAGSCLWGTNRLGIKVRLKGSASFQAITAKPSFTIKMEESTDSFPLPFGNKVHLNNCAQDPSLIRDFTARTMFERMGVPTPNVEHALVSLNGNSLGIFSVREAVGRHFFARAFGNPAGTAIEGEHRDCDLLTSNDTIPTNSSSISNVGWQSFNRTNIVRFIAAECITAHKDGLCENMNNYWLYQSDGKVQAFPHTLDQAFPVNWSALECNFESKVIRSFLVHEPHRREVVAAVAEGISILNRERLFVEIALHRQQLLKEIARSCPTSEANKICSEMTGLMRTITNHFDALSLALALENAGALHSNSLMQPAAWKIRRGPSAKSCLLSKTAEPLRIAINSQSGQFIVECPILLTPGAYRISGTFSKIRGEPSGYVRVGFKNETATMVGTSASPQDWACSTIVQPPDGRRIFRARMLRFNIEAQHGVKELVLDLGTITVLPLVRDKYRAPTDQRQHDGGG